MFTTKEVLSSPEIYHKTKVTLLPKVSCSIETSPTSHSIELPSSVTALCQLSPAMREITEETGNDLFNLHHASMVTKGFESIFFSLISLAPHNFNLATTLSNLYPILETGVFFHDIGKLDPRLNGSFASLEQSQGTREPDRVAYDHLHSTTGGLALQLLAKKETRPALIHQLNIMANIAFGHHETTNGNLIAEDGHPQFSYPRRLSRNKSHFEQLFFLSFKLADVVIATGHPRAYRKSPLPLGTTIHALNSVIEQYSLANLFPNYQTAQDSLKEKIIAFTLQTLAKSQKENPESISHNPNNIKFTLDGKPLPKKPKPTFTKNIFSQVYQEDEQKIEKIWYRLLEDIKHIH